MGKAMRGSTAKKGHRKGTGRSGSAAVSELHPVIVQADIPAAQRASRTFEVVKVPNPHGEVMQDGQLRQHTACRTVEHFRTLYRSKVFSDDVFRCLEWYDDRLARANGGMFKSGLDNSGGGGSAHHHIPTTQALMDARSDVAWARGFIPRLLLPAFDGVMLEGETFEALGARVYGHLCVDRAKRRASLDFKLAANHLMLGIGHRVGVADA